MNARFSTAIVLALLAAPALVGVEAQSVAPNFAGSSLTAPRSDWPTNGGDWYNRRYSPLKEINRDTVERLKGVWRVRLNGSGFGPQYSAEAQPIFFDGVLYVATPANDVFAIDVDSGDFLWTYEANLDPGISTVCCGWTNRGVAIGDGKVYMGQLDGKLVALDQATGNVVWSIQAERWQDGFTITTAPLYYDGLVITGFAGAEFGVRGRVKAYDADDGSLVWTFYTIPGPGELGHDTWPQDNEIWRSGGATVWQTPAVDPELGLVYFSTGNAGPDFNGAMRAGDNLFSASIVAVDVKTGQIPLALSASPSRSVGLRRTESRRSIRRRNRRRRTQGFGAGRQDGLGLHPRPNDRRTADRHRGACRAAGAAPGNCGYATVSDRRCLRPHCRWKSRLKGSSSATGAGSSRPIGRTTSLAKPGLRGGANWPPSSVDIETGYIYVCAADGASAFRAWEISAALPPAGEFYIGGNFGTNPMPLFGIFAALDLRTNKLVWQQHWPERCLSGSVTTAGGLVFVGRNDGRLTALDSATGAKRWEFQTGAGVNAPASVFEHGGREYVAVYSGGHSQGGAHGDSVWLFSLDGTLDEVAEATQQPITRVSGSGNAEVSLESGREAYASSCVFCHGADGRGGHGGPAFTTARSVDEIQRIVSTGRNLMPAVWQFPRRGSHRERQRVGARARAACRREAAPIDQRRYRRKREHRLWRSPYPAAAS